MTASELPEILQSEEFGFSPSLALQIGVMIGGHHGVFPRDENINPIQDNVDYRGGKKWKEARRLLTFELAELFSIKHAKPSITQANLDNATMMVLAGLVSVADWVGSNASFFPCLVSDQTQAFTLDLAAYKNNSERRAIQALTELGWMNWAEPDQPRAFSELFADIKTPHPLQQSAIELAPILSSPGIVVVEAPMGEGKTETAMSWPITGMQHCINVAFISLFQHKRPAIRCSGACRNFCGNVLLKNKRYCNFCTDTQHCQQNFKRC